MGCASSGVEEAWALVGRGELAYREVPAPGRGIDVMEAGTQLAGVKDWRGREGAGGSRSV